MFDPFPFQEEEITICFSILITGNYSVRMTCSICIRRNVSLKKEVSSCVLIDKILACKPGTC